MIWVGCTEIDTITVEEPQAMTGTISKCLGPTYGNLTAMVTGGVAPYQYEWDDALNQTTAEATNLAIGTYTVSITDSNGCELELSGAVSAGNDFPMPDLGADTNAATAVTLSPGSFAAYQWQDGTTTATFNAALSGTYWVVVGNSLGCSAADTINVEM